MIDVELLKKYGATQKMYNKHETIFDSNSTPKYFFQIVKGEIKMNNYNEEGSEFIQGIFSDGKSFGESPLIAGLKYPANAIALTKTTLILLPKDRFFDLLAENPKINFEISKILSRRLHYKATMAAELSNEGASHRILTLLDYLKESVYNLSGAFTYETKLTRQQIADLTGLRVETVIRIMRTMEREGEIKIINRKVFR